MGDSSSGRPPDRLDPAPGAADPAVWDGTAAGRGHGARRRRRAHHRAQCTRTPARGERPRTVPLPADARSLLRRWLTERANHPAAQRGEPALWLGRRDRLSARQLQRIVAELGADARLVDVSAHTLRHTAATRWLTRSVASNAMSAGTRQVA